MKFKFHVLLICIFSLLQASFAQEQKKLDSLLNRYHSQAKDSAKVHTAHAIFDYFFGHKPKLAHSYSIKALELAQEIAYEQGIAASYNLNGLYYMNVREIDSARNCFQKSINIYDSLNKQHEVGMVNYNLIQLSYLNADYGRVIKLISEAEVKYLQPVDSIILMKLNLIRSKVYMRQTKYELGFKHAFKSLAIAEALELDFDIAQIKSSIASLYHYTDNKPKAILIYTELLEYYRKKNNKIKMANMLNSIGNSNYVLKNYDTAIQYLTESLSYSEELEHHDLVGITLFNIGKTYVRLGEVNRGIEYLKRAVDYSRNISYNPLSESWSLKRLGDVYTEELNRPQEAIPYLNRAIFLADSVGNRDDLYQSYRDRSEAYAALGRYKEALNDHEVYKAINDSVYNFQKSKEIDRLTTEFETKEKEQQIALQKNEIDLLEQKDKVSKLQRSILTGGLLLTLGFLGFGFYGLQQKIKRNKLEKEKVDVELAFKKKELTTHALHLAKKNEVLESLKQTAEDLKKSAATSGGYQQLIRTINFDLKDDNNWQNFSNYFQEVHKDFNSNIKQKFPNVTSNELRLMALIKMNLSSKEIANILNISQEGIKKARYRLRKKLRISTEDSLQNLVLNL